MAVNQHPAHVLAINLRRQVKAQLNTHTCRSEKYWKEVKVVEFNVSHRDVVI